MHTPKNNSITVKLNHTSQIKDTEDDASKAGGYRHPGVTLSGEGDVWEAVCKNTIFIRCFNHKSTYSYV